MTTITIQINDNEPMKNHPQKKQHPQKKHVPWAIKMGQEICPPGDQFRFI